LLSCLSGSWWYRALFDQRLRGCAGQRWLDLYGVGAENSINRYD